VTGVETERKRRFDALFQEHVSGIASYCRWRSRPGGDDEDAAAEVFLIAWRRLDDVPAGKDGRAWLYATARRVMANQARGSARRVRLNEKLNAQPVAVEGERDDLSGRVREALAALPRRDREVLLLTEWEELTPAEIAKVMRCPAVTVRGRLHRARRRFRAAFERQEDLQGAAEHAPVSPVLGRCES
jgi:RNA polymerase sigma factor (sigma-70 family)